MKTLAVIVPVFNEEENLPVLYDRLITVAKGLPDVALQVFFIDDHSSDGTPAVLQSLHERDERIEWLRLSRNSGSQIACVAGLERCDADATVIMAADMQDPPELLPRLLEKHAGGAQLVWAIREARQGESFPTRAFSELFYWLMNRMTGLSMPPKGAVIFLADRRVIQAFREVRDRQISLFAVFAWLGFKQDSITYVAPPRHSGVSKWTFSKKVLLAIDSFIGFSYLPLRFMSLSGILFAAGGGVWASYIFVMKVLGHTLTTGYASIIITMLVIGGLQMLMLGVLGEYHWRTLEEARSRPRYFIERSTLESKTSS